MSFITWLLLGVGAFLIYCAVKAKNPIELVTGKLGIQVA